MNRCMHMLFQYCISTVMDEYNINFDGSYCKYDVIGHPKEVNFSRGPILPIPAVLEFLSQSKWHHQRHHLVAPPFSVWLELTKKWALGYRFFSVVVQIPTSCRCNSFFMKNCPFHKTFIYPVKDRKGILAVSRSRTKKAMYIFHQIAEISSN